MYFVVLIPTSGVKQNEKERQERLMSCHDSAVLWQPVHTPYVVCYVNSHHSPQTNTQRERERLVSCNDGVVEKTVQDRMYLCCVCVLCRLVPTAHNNGDRATTAVSSSSARALNAKVLTPFFSFLRTDGT